MSAITITDLNNAKLDTDTIAGVATSQSLTVTDRLGNLKSTVFGAVQTLKAFNLRGVWATATAYTLKDVYTYSGYAYVVITAHTSTTVAADLTSGYVTIHQGATREDLASVGGAAFVGTSSLGLPVRSLQSVLSDTVSIKAAGALGGGVINEEASVQAVYDALTAFGGEVKIPLGTYRMGAINGTCLSIKKPISLRGDGGVYTAFNPDLAVSTDNTITVTPSPNYDYTGLKISGIALHNPLTGQRSGNNGIYADTTQAGANLSKFTLRDFIIGQGNNASGYAFYHYNNPANNVNGGMYCALIENSIFKGGIRLDSSGDSNSIVHNTLTGSQIGVTATLISGASLLEIQANNITANNGSIRIESGSRFRIIGNNCENFSAGSLANNSGALCNINGGSGAMYGGVIKENLFSAFSASDATTLIRLRNSRGTLIQDNVLLSSTSNKVGIDIGPDCFDVRVGPNSFDAAVVTQVVDNGLGTMGVLKTPTLLNGWVAYSASFGTLQYIKSTDGLVHVTGSVMGGTIANGTLIASFAAGFRPSQIMRFSALKLTAGVQGVAVCTLEPSGDFRFTYASADEMTVNFTFAANNLANSISLE